MIDWARLDSLDDGSPDGRMRLRNLVRLFLETSQDSLGTLRAAQRDGLSRELADALHRLKGSCATLGARAMLELVQAGEAKVRAGDTGDLEGLLVRLETAFAATKAVLAPRA